MTLEQLGNLGETIGGIAVVITLIYLAVQVRQNSSQLARSAQSAQVSTHNAIQVASNEFRALLLDDAQLSRIYVDGLRDLASLSPEERHRFNQLLATFIWDQWTMVRFVDSGLFDDVAEISRAESHAGQGAMLRDLLRHPGGREWYSTYRGYLPDRFTEILDRIRAEVERDNAGFTSDDDAVPSMMFGGAIASSARAGDKAS